ncbi:MAG: phosphate ABC transporter ATP-binding protein PstB [Acidobacteriota bacterium]
MSVIQTRDLNLHYGSFHALIGITMTIQPQRITSIIGPSGCGKSTLLRTFNRMNELIQGVRITGEVVVEGTNVYSPECNVEQLRQRGGMVFQRPNPFPLSVFENVAFGPRIHKTARGEELERIVEESLRAVLLWDGLKDRLRETALALSLEQKQRLCIARAIAARPRILLMDEPCSALDPIATAKIEELMLELKTNYTIVIVTHNMQQAARISDDTGFMLLGELIEFGTTSQVFTAPGDERTERYITGRFG